MNPERIDCFKCKYFYITWEPVFPNGCKAFGFKTSGLPAQEVLKASGANCLHFESKGKSVTKSENG